MTTWVVVADSSRGRIYLQQDPRSALIEVEDLIHASSRLHAGDLVSDHAGSDSGSVGQGRHLMDARTDIKAHEAAIFAKEIAERLERARVAGKFEHLVLMAPPAFLGILRATLNDKLRDIVIGEMDKSLVMQSTKEVQQHLSQVI